MDKNKTVYIKFSVRVDFNSIERMTHQILEQLSLGVDKFIILISSPGGNVLAGISGYNFLRGIPAEVIMHNYGSVDSIATVMYCAGSTRYCVPHATFTLHGVTLDIKSHFTFSEKTLKERVSSLGADREIMSRVIADNTGRDLAIVEHEILEGIVLNSDQALEYGLVHKIKVELFETGAKVIEIV